MRKNNKTYNFFFVSHKNEMFIFLSIFCLFSLDLVSKWLFKDVSFMKGGFGLNYVINKGSSFGIFKSLDYYNSFMVFFSVSVLIFVLLKYEKFNNLFLIFFLSGLIGNLYDRIFYDGVRDFIVTPFFVFNLADFYLNLSGLILFFGFIMDLKR